MLQDKLKLKRQDIGKEREELLKSLVYKIIIIIKHSLLINTKIYLLN